MFQLKDKFQSGSLRGVLCNTENLHGGPDDSTFLAYTLSSQVASSTHPLCKIGASTHFIGKQESKSTSEKWVHISDASHCNDVNSSTECAALNHAQMLGTIW